MDNNWNFFVDIDGTIYSSDPREWEYNLKQFKLFCNEFNVNRFIVTGRHPMNTLDILCEFPLTKGGLITLNGGLVFVDGEVISANPFDDEIARKIYNYLFKIEGTFVISTRKGFVYAKVNEYLNQYYLYIKDYNQYHNKKTAKQVKSFDDLIKKNKIFKFIHFTNSAIPQKETLEFFHNLNLDYGCSLAKTFEINPKGTNKGAGIQKLITYLQLNPKKLIGIGDGENDISTAKICKYFVAMNQAAPRLKQVATKVAEDKGFAWSLKALHFLIKEGENL